MGMTRDEFSVLVKSMKAVWADPKFIPDQDAFNVWYALLRHLEYKNAAAAVQAYMLTSQFPPTVADINRGASQPVVEIEELSDAEAWDLVWRAICDSTYHAVERFNELPAPVQKAVGSADNLRMIAMQEGANPGVEKSHFLNSYHIVIKRLKEDAEQMALLPPSVRETLKLARKKATEQIEVKDDERAGDKTEG